MYHRAYREIDLKAIDHNFDVISGLIDKDTKKCAVVKADAYGHGAVEVAMLLQNKADYFAVASIGEAIEIRNAGITLPILVLAYTSPLCYGDLIDYDVTATIYSYEDACLLNEEAEKKGKKAKIHIAVDTGMSRIGFDLSDKSADTVKKITSLPYIFTEGIFSHFAKADFKDKTHALAQRDIFDSFLKKLTDRDVNIPIKHLYNSAAVVSFGSRYDMVRMGIVLYGINPFDHEAEIPDLWPAMTVKTNVIHLHTVEEGEGVSYGHLYVADKKRKIATLSMGYADGLKRRLSNVGYFLINGKKAPITGRVCMDIVMVDVTDIDNVKIGDEAVLVGKSGDAEISAEEYGKMYGSFAYEVLSTFMPRVRKIFK